MNYKKVISTLDHQINLNVELPQWQRSAVVYSGSVERKSPGISSGSRRDLVGISSGYLRYRLVAV